MYYIYTHNSHIDYNMWSAEAMFGLLFYTKGLDYVKKILKNI